MVQKFRQLVSSSDCDKVFKVALEKVYRQFEPSHCFVASLESCGQRATTLCYLVDGELTDNFSYPLAGSPCQVLLGGEGFCYYEKNIQQLFPADKALQSLSVQAYIGTLLYSDEQQVIGLLVCLFKQPLTNDQVHVDWLSTLSHFIAQQVWQQQPQQITKRLQAQLEAGERVAKIGTWRWDISNELYSWSNEVYRIFELDPAIGDLNYQQLAQFIHDDDRERVRQFFSAAATGQQAKLDVVFRIELNDDKIKYLHVMADVSMDRDGTLSRLEGTLQDVTELNQLNLDKQLSDFVFNHTSESVMITNNNNQIVSVNKAMEQLTGYSQAELFGRNPNMLSSGLQDQKFYIKMWQCLVQTGQWKGELWNKHKNGQVFPEELAINLVKNEQGDTTHHVAIFRDISQWKTTEKQLRFYAECDPLTKLTNRRVFIEQLELHLQDCATDCVSAVVSIDLDHFKEINDIYGNDIGDLLLVETARRLSSIACEHDVVCRYGGNEFTLLLSNCSCEHAKIIAQKIQRCFKQGIRLAGFVVNTTVSIGVAMYPSSGDSAKLLLRHASQAMANVKSSGRNGIAFYDVELQRLYQRKLELKEQLIVALEQQQLCVFYQPIVDIETNKIAKFEALVRWHDGQGGYISPVEFIPIAQEFGLISQVGNFVLERACRDLKVLHQQGHQEISFSVNRSISELCDLKQQSIESTIVASGLPYDSIVIEITESIAMSENRYAKQALAQLKEKGIKIALDDFCTGYSSLNYLVDYDIDLIKIDRTFVKAIGHDIKSKILTSTVLELARKLDLEVIAEGVETEQQMVFLRQSGCRFIQGFYFSPALDITHCQALLAEQVSSPAWHAIVDNC